MFAKTILLVFVVVLLFSSEVGARSVNLNNDSTSNGIPSTSQLEKVRQGDSEQKPTASKDIAIHSAAKMMKDTDDGLQWQECFFNLFKCIP